MSHSNKNMKNLSSSIKSYLVKNPHYRTSYSKKKRISWVYKLSSQRVRHNSHSYKHRTNNFNKRLNDWGSQRRKSESSSLSIKKQWRTVTLLSIQSSSKKWCHSYSRRMMSSSSTLWWVISNYRSEKKRTRLKT